MRRTGRGWDPSFFCRFVKSALAFAFGAVMLSADLLPWFDALPPFVGGIPCRLFLPLVDRTMAGVHDLLRRFSHSLSPGIWTKLKRSSNEGHGPLEVRSPGPFLCSFRLLVGNLPPRATAQSIRASSVRYVQFIARTFGYAAMS